MNKAKVHSIILAFLMVLAVVSCKTAAREERYYEKQEEKIAAEEKKAYEQKVRDHMNMQSKETLKSMKQLERQSKKLNNSRKR